MNPEMDETPVSLVVEAQAGSSSAFAALTARHRQPIVALCQRWTRGNRADAEDMAQETFLRAYLRLAQLQDPSCFPVWLSRIALNVCRNWSARQPVPTLPLEEAFVEPRPAEAEYRERQTALYDALAALPPDLRRTIRLFYLHGHTMRELAVWWNVPQSTVKGRLDAGRRLMRKELERMGMGNDETTRAAQTPANDLPNGSVMLSDSSPADTKQIRAALKAAGYAPALLGPDADVLTRLRRTVPDILILKLPFGGLDVYEILRAIRQDARLRAISVMFVRDRSETEAATHADIFRAWNLGVDCYLTTPYNAGEVAHFAGRMDGARKAIELRSLAMGHAWRGENADALRVLAQAIALGGDGADWRLDNKTVADSVRDDPAFRALQTLPEFLALLGEPSPASKPSV